MAPEDRDKDAPSLEPPSLFGRKRRKQAAPPEQAPASSPASEQTPAEASAPAPAAPDDPAPAPAPPAPDPAGAERAPAAAAPVEPAPPEGNHEETRVDLPAASSDATPTEVIRPTEPAPQARVEDEPTAPPLFADEVETGSAVRRPRRWPTRPTAGATPSPAQQPAPAAQVASPAPATPALAVEHTAPVEPTEPVAPAEPTAPREPFVTGMAAVCLTGALVGLGTVALTWAALQVCEVAKGTSSCGNPGFFLLLAILVGMGLAGSALLRTFRVPEPGSTSFLAVGVLTVLVLLFLVEVLFSAAMIVVIPLFATACFALSHWVSTAFVETD